MQPGDAARMRNIAVSSFFRAAFEQDMYPAEDMEGCFGVHMDDGVGAVVFNSWKTLFLRGKINEANVKRAIAGGNLPAFFEETVRSLSTEPGSEATHSSYTLRLIGHDVSMPPRWTLPSGSLFGHIQWDRRVLAAMAEAPASVGRAPAVARRHADIQPRQLFPDEPALGTPVAQGVVTSIESADGTPIAVAQPIEVTEGSPLAPAEEQMLRSHLDRVFVGRVFVLRHLTSERGRQLNGRLARVVGRDVAPGKYRLHVSVDGGAPFRVLPTNLADPSRPTRAPAIATDDEAAVLRVLRGLLDAHYPVGQEPTLRTDMRARIGFLRSHVEAGRVPPPTRCGDGVRRDAEHSSWVQTLSHMRPCCHGDNVCDLRRFDLKDEASLKEWVVTGTCEACQAILFAEPGEGGDEEMM